MSYTLEDFERDVAEEKQRDYKAYRKIKAMCADDFLKSLSIEERLKGISKQEIQDYLTRLNNQDEEDKHH